MAKRRISAGKMREIAETRMSRLLELSSQERSAGNLDRARRYVHLARRIGMRTRTPMPRGLRHCKSCLSPLVPGVNCRVRLSKGILGIHCLDCGNSRRMPYTREKGENDREDGKEGTAQEG